MENFDLFKFCLIFMGCCIGLLIPLRISLFFTERSLSKIKRRLKELCEIQILYEKIVYIKCEYAKLLHKQIDDHDPKISYLDLLDLKSLMNLRDEFYNYCNNTENEKNITFEKIKEKFGWSVNLLTKVAEKISYNDDEFKKQCEFYQENKEYLG